MKVHYFNPGHETAVLNGSPYYMAPANVAVMQRDLAFLPAWYGDKMDIVLIDKYIADYYAATTSTFPFLPKAVTKTQLSNYVDSEICCWGISPQAIHFFEGLNNEYRLNLIIPNWHEEYLYLNSRKAAHDCLSELCNQMPDIDTSIIPQFYTGLEEIALAVKNADYKLLAKAPYSSSGRGLLWLPPSGLTRTENQILHGILKKQGYVCVERVLERQLDFAMEFMSDGGGQVEFAGYSLFYTNIKGGYESNYIGAQYKIEQQLLSLVSPSLIEEVKRNLKIVLAEKFGRIYKGCIGVDMMVYKRDGKYRLHPCLEINMRYNMGYLSLCLYQKYIADEAEGRFFLDFNPQSGKMYTEHCRMLSTHPAVYSNGKLSKGYLSLCPVTEDTRYRAYVLID